MIDRREIGGAIGSGNDLAILRQKSPAGLIKGKIDVRNPVDSAHVRHEQNAAAIRRDEQHVDVRWESVAHIAQGDGGAGHKAAGSAYGDSGGMRVGDAGIANSDGIWIGE